jgi:hypothetical protein
MSFAWIFCSQRAKPMENEADQAPEQPQNDSRES